MPISNDTKVVERNFELEIMTDCFAALAMKH